MNLLNDRWHSDTINIRLAELPDIPNYWEHLWRHTFESGRDGDVIFSPFEGNWNGTLEDIFEDKKNKWTRPTNEVGWERTWIICGGNSILGDIKLVHQPALTTTLHRATLMMGIERSQRNLGLGSRLITTAITWAHQQPGLEWIQLNVFANNTPALHLYQKFGFREVGRTPDFFRICGHSIEDITMILNVRDVDLRILVDF